MNTAVCLLLVFLETFASAQDYRSYHPEAFGSENEQSQQASAEYNYSYDVRDDTTGDRKSQEESRNGNIVRGRYSVLDADGSTRVVEYTVDPQSGFNAVVRRDGEQISLPIPNSRVNLINQNQYESRRIQSNPTLIRNHQSGRYVYPNTGTRLAQDARTGNVIDVASGFGAVPHFSSNQNVQSNPSVRVLSNQVSTARVIPSSNELTNYRTQVGQISQDDVQETYARSQYQTAFPVGQHVTNSPSHSYTPHFRANYNTRVNSVLNRFAAPRQSQVDVRTPTAILPNADSSIMQQNFDSNRQGNEQSNFNFPANNDYTLNELYQQNLENPTEQGGIVSSTPAPQHLIGAIPEVAQESNRSDSALFRQEHQVFGARINVYNAPNMQHQDQSFNQGSFTANIPQEPSQSYEGVSNTRPTIATRENYQDSSVTVEAIGNHQIFEQRHLYPASTTPLEANNADHFFTRSLIGQGLTVQADQVNIPNYNTITSQFDQVPVTPIHYPSTISHDVHLIH